MVQKVVLGGSPQNHQSMGLSQTSCTLRVYAYYFFQSLFDCSNKASQADCKLVHAGLTRLQSLIPCHTLKSVHNAYALCPTGRVSEHGADPHLPCSRRKYRTADFYSSVRHFATCQGLSSHAHPCGRQVSCSSGLALVILHAW